MNGVIRLIIIIAIGMHGIGHIMGFLAAWTNVPVGFNDQPWLFSSGVTTSSGIGKLFGLVWLAVLVVYGVGVYGLLSGQDWWPAVLVIASIASLVVVLPWFNTMPAGSRVGAILMDLVLLVALLPGWRDSVIPFLVGQA